MKGLKICHGFLFLLISRLLQKTLQIHHQKLFSFLSQCHPVRFASIECKVRIKIVVENDNTEKKKKNSWKKLLFNAISFHLASFLSFDGHHHHAEYHQHVFISFYYSERIFLNYKTFSNFLIVFTSSLSLSLYDPIVLVIKVEDFVSPHSICCFFFFFFVVPGAFIRELKASVTFPLLIE